MKSIGTTEMANSRHVAIVTGAARPWGLGRCTAMGLAAKGFDIAVVDMKDDWGEAAAATIKRETETTAAYVKTDLRQRSDVEAMVTRVIREFGRIDVLANIAAICPSERIEDMKEDTYEQVFRTNFLGTAFCCQAVLKQMRSQNSGRIVNIASGGAFLPYAGLALYGAAKAAVIQFSKVLAFEEAKNGIVVTIVAPGPMHTAMGRESGPTEDDLKQLGASMPMGRPCYPEEVAEVIVFAATNSSNVLTGQTLHARGGALPMV
jgi:NAD(P)-dependent dehydrogenase (short-subunit alcohol dehydrogenase family)